MQTSAQIDLRQYKLVTQGHAYRPARFGVLSRAQAAFPTLLSHPFVVQTGLDAEESERLHGVARLLDLPVYPVNPLTAFASLRANGFASYAPGYVLRISNPPVEWYPDTPDSFPVQQDFPVTRDALTGRLILEAPVHYAVKALEWRLMNGSSVVLAGTDGRMERLNPTPGLYRTDRWCGLFDYAAEAIDHITYIQTHIKSLVKHASIDGDGYLDLPPGNPINVTYTA